MAIANQQRMEDKAFFKGGLAKVAVLNDMAVAKWLADKGPKSQIQALFHQAALRANEISRSLLRSGKIHPHHTVDPTDLPKKRTNHVPRSVLVHTNAETLTFRKAFLIGDTILNDESSLDSATIAFAVVFYNMGLFFHHQLEAKAKIDPKITTEYYLAANRLLTNYMDRTRRPLWSLQAAIWHNVSECCAQYHQCPRVNNVYFGQLETIIGYVMDSEERSFFQTAVLAVRLQPNVE